MISGQPLDPPAYWARGTQIVWRYGAVDRPHVADALTVVRDDAEWLVAWLEVGTPRLMWAREDGLGIREDKATIFTAPRIQVETTWQGFSVLRVYRKGASWSTWLFFDGERFQGWYCNIEEPHRRVGLETHSSDRLLDVWVGLDREPHRKDEDELEWSVSQGRYTRDEAAAITAVADEIEAAVAAWGSPFCDGWESFQPDPSWPTPALPGPPAARSGPTTATT